jgi:hypothetical protein
MPVECSRLFQARAVVAPLECRTVAGPFKRAVVLTDVVFELDSHPNGFQSRACGFVWNALAGQWSSKLMGGHVDDAGRRYDLESGMLCPAGSTLSVCTCLFIAFPTSTIFALLTGYSCQESHVDVSGVKAVGGGYSIDWLETQSGALDPHDPTGVGAATGDVEHALGERELVGTVREHVHPGDLVVHGADGTTTLPHGSTLAVRLAGHEPTLQSDGEEGTTRLPEGTNLVVVRRSADGRSVHWLCYREQEPAGAA